MTKTKLIALIMFITAAGVAGHLIDRGVANAPRQEAPGIGFVPQIASADVDLAGLEQAALASCQCRQGGGDSAACDADYVAKLSSIQDRIRGDHQQEQEMPTSFTACSPLSTKMDCLVFSDGGQCVVTEFRAVTASETNRDVLVCTKAEAKAIEVAYNQAQLINGQKVDRDDNAASAAANARANAAIQDILQRIRAGEKFSPAAAESGGCV